MGSRGPLRDPNSIRGERETRQQRRKCATDPRSITPTMPDWLPETAASDWRAVVRDLLAADVVLQRIDGFSIGLFVLTIQETRKAAEKGDTKLAARLGRDALQWAAAVGATPAARARLNIKPAKPAVKDDPWALLD
jgi:phage terminase small subunit